MRLDGCDDLERTRTSRHSHLLSPDVVIVKATNETRLPSVMDYLVFALLGLPVPFDNVVTASLELSTRSVWFL